MTKEETITVFRIINKFSMINEHILRYTILEQFIQSIKMSEGAAKIGATFAFYHYLKEKHSKEIAEEVFAKLVEMGKITSHPLSTYEGFLEAFVSEMSSGASFGGALSGAGSNAQVNATGLAGIDKPLGLKKRKIDKILTH